MKKWMVFLAVAMCLTALPLGVQAYTVSDLPNDAIGVRTFESYGLNVYNYTPGSYTGAIAFDLFTNYPQAGLTVGSWATQPADLFINEVYYGNSYQWAIPLVNHDGFTAGTMYAVGTYLISDNFEPAGGGYIYNHGVPVRLQTVGNNYGATAFGGGSVVWNNNTPPGSPDWRIRITTGNVYQDDPNGTYSYIWGTATCGNDVVNSVPEPGTLLLLGSGLLGLVVAGRNKFRK